MKKSIALLMTIALIVSCGKEDKSENLDILESYSKIKADDDIETCYNKVQAYYEEGKLHHEMLINNKGVDPYQNLEQRIPLYSTFVITEAKETNQKDSIEFSFEDENLQFINVLNRISGLTSGPTTIEQWPENMNNELVIKRYNSKSEIINKLKAMQISSSIQFPLIDKVYFTGKDLNKSYDNYLNTSILWVIPTIHDDEAKDSSHNLIIVFKDGKVNSISIEERIIVGLL